MGSRCQFLLCLQRVYLTLNQCCDVGKVCLLEPLLGPGGVFWGRMGRELKKKKASAFEGKPMLGSRLRKVLSKKGRSKFLGRTRFQMIDHYCGDCGPLVGDMEISTTPWCPLHSGSRFTRVAGGASGAELLQWPSYGCSSP